MPSNTLYPTAKVLTWQRKRSSVYGNPRYRAVLELPDGQVIEATTRPDASLAYAAPSRPNKLHNVKLHTTPSGRVYLTSCEFE